MFDDLNDDDSKLDLDFPKTSITEVDILHEIAPIVFDQLAVTNSTCAETITTSLIRQTSLGIELNMII